VIGAIFLASILGFLRLNNGNPQRVGQPEVGKESTAPSQPAAAAPYLEAVPEVAIKTFAPEQLRAVPADKPGKVWTVEDPNAKIPALVPTPARQLVPSAPYHRPALAPNGQPWPTTSGYFGEQSSASGNSLVTVDNTQNSSDMLVKLCKSHSRPCSAIRVFFLRAYERFKLENVEPGDYDIRYKDLDSDVISKSEQFALKERQEDIQEPDGGVLHRTHSTEYDLTLYKVVDGNTHSEIIGPDEF
jgi:hypothetical protein